MKNIFTYLFILAVLLLSSCNNSTDRHADHASLGDDGSNNGSSCKMNITWDKQQPSTGDSIRFTFIPRWQPNNTIATLEKVHEKKIHFIVVSDDLSYFDHLHLDEDSSGIYHISTSFPSGGKYLLIADYKAKGIAQQADTFSITVSGKTSTAVTYTAEQLTNSVNQYQVQLLHKKLAAGKQAMVIMKINKDDKSMPRDSLQTYLGEYAHMIAINTSTKEYAHMHSMSDPMSYWFMGVFRDTGLYKVWIQFKKDNIVTTVPFIIKVE